MDIIDIFKHSPLLSLVAQGIEVEWVNHNISHFTLCKNSLPVTTDGIKDASDRFKRFAPVIAQLFPETAVTSGIIESELNEIPKMKSVMNDMLSEKNRINGRLFIKLDSHLPVSGSVKARGGFYEVLKHAEDIALKAGLLECAKDDYCKLLLPSAKTFFNQYKIQVGSTGNLGLSIGIMAAALGFQATVHMSMDAKAWKKELLREHGVTVIEYDGDYSEAVQQGRKESDADPLSYFVDDENSVELFYGYAVSGERIHGQLEATGVIVDNLHPLFVYIPCGVGGAPGGITYGLKQVYGDDVHIFFVEPTQAPCMLVGLASGALNQISVQDIGLSGKTQADGLAVGRCSGLVSPIANKIITGIYTVEDVHLYRYLRELYGSESIFIEPSAAAAFHGLLSFMQGNIKSSFSSEQLSNATHVVWATGGNLVPYQIRNKLLGVCD